MSDFGQDRPHACGGSASLASQGRSLRSRAAVWLTSGSLGVLAASLGVSHAAAAPTLPTHGVVVSGQAVITAPSSGALTVTQSSKDAIINWNSFSIGQGGAVQINNGSGATLNRVTGGSISSIDGLLSATGSVYLINPNGVIIGKTGVVDTGGTFVASTLDISDNSFLGGGDLTFAGASTANVFNLGKVGSLGGNVALIAQTVENDGSLTAPGGAVGLIAGQQVTLKDADNDGDGLFSVRLGGPKTSVTNTGVIAAANAELRAEQGNVYALAGNTTGVIRATGVSASGGKIWLVADGGTTTVAGTLDARGANGAAGRIETSGQTVVVDSSTIDAHGGQWLLDPQNIEITAAAAATISSALATSDVTEQTTATGANESGATSGATVSSGAGDITLDAGAAISWSSSHALTLEAYNNLILNGTVSFSGGGTLNLTAGQALTINAPITVSGAGAVNLTYNNAVTANLGFGQSGSLVFDTASGAVATSSQGGALTINDQAYTLIYTAAALQAMSLGGDYALAQSLDLTGATWTPIGETANGVIVRGGFTGVFDGLGDTISNLTLTSIRPNVGLFGEVGSGGVVTNVILANADVSGGNDTGALAGESAGAVSGVNVTSGLTKGGSYVGGLVGYNTGTISDITLRDSVQGVNYVGGMTGYNSGAVTYVQDYANSVTGANYVGGVVGYSTGATIVDATSYAEAISGTNYVGGVVGDLQSGEISDGEAVSNIQASNYDAGGIAGYSAGAIYGSNVYEGYIGPTLFGTVNGAHNVGGAVGYNAAGGTLNYTNAHGDVTGTGADTGGLVGYNAGAISNAVADGQVSGQTFVGGLVGYNTATGVITDISANATAQAVGGSVWVGGLAGYNSGTIGQAGAGVASNATVTGSGDDVGGLVGRNDGTVTASTASGSVTGADDTGGLIGVNLASVTASTASSSVTGETFTGGLVGFNSGAISGSGATGQVSGTNITGGLVGGNIGAGTITNIVADTTAQIVGGNSDVGGLVGYNTGSVGAAGSTVAANADVTAAGNEAGGLIGYNNAGNVIDATAAGSVSGANDVGGLIGYNYHGAVTGSTTTASVSAAGRAKGPVYGANVP